MSRKEGNIAQRPYSFVSLGLYSNVQNRIRLQIIKQKWRYVSQEFSMQKKGKRGRPTPRLRTVKAAVLTDLQSLCSKSVTGRSVARLDKRKSVFNLRSSLIGNRLLGTLMMSFTKPLIQSLCHLNVLRVYSSS